MFKARNWFNIEHCFKGSAFVFRKYDNADFKPVKFWGYVFSEKWYRIPCNLRDRKVYFAYYAHFKAITVL